MAPAPDRVYWLQHAGQRLGLLPGRGGAIAAWRLDHLAGTAASHRAPLDLLRPWSGSADTYSLASISLLPWSNRISGGGFVQDGVFHPLQANHAGEPYPIHGEGWLQSWHVTQQTANALEMCLDSDGFQGSPYAYRAEQGFVLHDDGMDQRLRITHIGAIPLPYGLGQHPWFLRSAGTRLRARAHGVWQAGVDSLPTQHSASFAPGSDPNDGMSMNGTLIDNAYTGWSGQACISWPELGLELVVEHAEVLDRAHDDGYFIVYRPPQGSSFCFEPVTHPVDAVHLDGRPGLRVLQPGESMSLNLRWRFRAEV
jgi:aldose 1-epimerase